MAKACKRESMICFPGPFPSTALLDVLLYIRDKIGERRLIFRLVKHAPFVRFMLSNSSLKLLIIALEYLKYKPTLVEILLIWEYNRRP